MQYCATPGCSQLVNRGHCSAHKRQTDQGFRGTAHQRGYTSRWAAYSRRFRLAHPVCGERADGTVDRSHSRCAQRGLTTPAECVDHIVPLSQGGAPWDPTNHLSLCLACNTWKAATIERTLHGRQAESQSRATSAQEQPRTKENQVESNEGVDPYGVRPLQMTTSETASELRADVRGIEPVS